MSFFNTILSSLNTHHRSSHEFIVIILFNEVCELSSGDSKSFRVLAELFVERLKISAFRWFGLWFSQNFMFLH